MKNQKVTQKSKLAAHFLLNCDLVYSPPNEAIVSALLDLGYEVHLFAPGMDFDTTAYGLKVKAHPVEYGRGWLVRNGLSPSWRRYSVFSGTSEDPLAVVGLLSWLHRRPSFILADEIKSGSYRGNAPEYWKNLCRWAMRRAKFNIVNDESRINLLKEYAAIRGNGKIIVYPGCYRDPPPGADRNVMREQWGVPEGALLVAASGGFNLSAGADWLIQALEQLPELRVAIQPLAIDPLARFLLEQIRGRERLYIEPARMGWKEAWASAAAFDVGLAIYRNPAPQFQNMGISSNRLCMFLAMGVPVIASRQPSFEFIEKYNCGVLVERPQDLAAAIDQIAMNLDSMKANALQCSQEYIQAPARWVELRNALARTLSS